MNLFVFLFVGSPLTDVGWHFEIERRLQQMPVLREYYLSIDLMEDDEDRFLHLHQWDNDVAMMEWRLENITDDTPASFLKHTLPPKEVAMRNWMLARQWVTFLQQRVEWAQWHAPNQLNDWKALLEDAEWRCRVWDCADDITSPDVRNKGRRLDLERLRTLVGTDAFLSGQWPDPLPPAAHNANWRPQ